MAFHQFPCFCSQTPAGSRERSPRHLGHEGSGCPGFRERHPSLCWVGGWGLAEHPSPAGHTVEQRNKTWPSEHRLRGESRVGETGLWEEGAKDASECLQSPYFQCTILFFYFWLRWVFIAVHGAFCSCSEQGCALLWCSKALFFLSLAAVVTGVHITWTPVMS